MEKSIDISIVIPCYKSEKTLPLCLQSVIAQSTRLVYEIIVVDSSPDNTTDHIVASFPQIKFIKLKKQTFAGIARNIGVSSANGKWLLFLDSDVIIPANFLDQAFPFTAKYDIFVPAMEMWDQEQASLTNRLEWFFEFCEFKPGMPEATRWCLPTYALIAKKEIFDKVAFENLQHAEDTELTIRLRSQGHLLYFVPHIKIFHFFQNNIFQVFKKAYFFGEGSVQIRRLHRVSGSTLVNNRLTFVFAVPLFTIIKFAKITWRNIRYNRWKDKITYCLALPLMVMLFFFWMCGFYRK